MVNEVVFVLGFNKTIIRVNNDHCILTVSNVLNCLDTSEEICIPVCDPEIFKAILTFCDIFYEAHVVTSKKYNINEYIFYSGHKNTNSNILSFIDEIYQYGMLITLLEKANYLDISPLIELLCLKVSSI